MRKQPFGRLAIVIAATIFWVDGSAYEVNVHESMTENAFNAAYVDPNEELFRRLRIKADQLFGDLFFGGVLPEWHLHAVARLGAKR